MVKIVVFDSGLGSLSVIKPIQKKLKSEIIYFADQKNYPYGLKKKSDLRKIIEDSIIFLNKKFNPDLIVIASNTPSLLFQDLLSRKIIGVFPPLIIARKISQKRNIAILTTKNILNSNELKKFIKKNTPTDNFCVYRINASNLVDLVESGKFLTNKRYCDRIIRKELKIINQKNIDVVTLSSTHLPFLRRLLEKQFPSVIFLDPAETIADKISKMELEKSKRNSVQIFSSGNIKKFERQLRILKIRAGVNYLSV